MNWNKVQDCLPEKFKECILYPYPGNDSITGFLSNDGFYFSESTNWGVEHRKLDNITHWIYLEEPEDEL